jgi:tRNA 2-thiouridine synthesizing protein E
MTVNGKNVETDKEGYLLNMKDWNKEVCLGLAKKFKLELSDYHWEVINFLRTYYKESGVTPGVPGVVKGLKRLNPWRYDRKFLKKLFTTNPCQLACRVAGLPKPFCYPC